MLITNVININANILKKIGFIMSTPDLDLSPGVFFSPGFLGGFGVTVGFGSLPFSDLLLGVTNLFVVVCLGFVSPSVKPDEAICLRRNQSILMAEQVSRD